MADPDETSTSTRTQPQGEIARMVDAFPQDAPDEAFVSSLRGHHCKKLRTACTELGLHPQADPATNHKDGYIELLSQYRRARQRGEVFTGHSAKARTKPKPKKRAVMNEVGGKTKHCAFRLVNVLFSSSFYPKMVESGALPSSGLEVEETDGRARFWRDVAVAYASENPKFDVVVGQAGRYNDIKPGMAPHHSSAKLCVIWKDLTARYEVILARWKQLGTGEAGFAHFCGDYLDVMYLHDWLQIRPIQVGTEQLRAAKRARTDDSRQENENASTGSDSNEENERVERRNFLVPQMEATPQFLGTSSDGIQEPIERRHLVDASEMQATTQHRILSTDGVQDAPRRALPRPDTLQMSMPLRDTRERVQRERRSLTTMEERMQQFRDAGVERHRVSSYDGVIYSSQAVRDTMAAIEALKRGRFNQTVIAQAEESMDAIVQVWLRELDKAGRPRANW